MDQKSILQGDMILVVETTVKSLDELAGIRDYVVQSLGVGVLALSPGMSYRLEHMPLSGVDGVQIEHQPIPEMPEPKPPASPAQEKQAILEKLAAYRKRHGLGAYGTLAQKYGRGGKDFAAETLRSLAENSITLPIEDWRRIGRALDKAVADE